eukprot:403338614
MRVALSSQLTNAADTITAGIIINPSTAVDPGFPRITTSLETMKYKSDCTIVNVFATDTHLQDAKQNSTTYMQKSIQVRMFHLYDGQLQSSQDNLIVQKMAQTAKIIKISIVQTSPEKFLVIGL